MGFTITTDSNLRSTQISNIFITEYMPSANGNFVKVYLYLLMASQQPSIATNLSVSSLADEMECTENDIVRAIHYWQKEGLLTLQESGQDIQGIILLEPWTSSAANLHSESFSTPVPEITSEPPVLSETAATTTISVPNKQTYTPLQAEALIKDIEIDKTITAIEKLLGSTVSPAHLQTILYFMCDIGFSSELMITLYDTAAKKGKTSTSYIEAIGISWAKQGIHSSEEAKEESASFSGLYALVARSFNLKNGLLPAQREIVDRWNHYHFSDSIIKEACDRTVLKTGGVNLEYTSSILEDWHKKNVISLDDVKKCDESYKRQKQNKSEKKKSVSSKNQFQNFPQRSYSQSDYNSLERKLLQGTKG